MERLYTEVFEEHLREHRQMLFIMGPRQVGKTTTSLALKKKWGDGLYFNWDTIRDRRLILEGSQAFESLVKANELKEKPLLVIFDEIHKFDDWKNFLKSFFDTFSSEVKILVTGSARLNVFKKGGDSLMGRYFYYRYHPLSVGELIHPKEILKGFRKKPGKLLEKKFKTLLEFGGFPDPFLKNNRRFYNRWKKIRLEQLFEEEVRDLSRIQEIAQMEILAEILRDQIGQLVSFESLAKKVRVSSPTIRHWLEILKSFYYCFEIRPFHQNITRSLLKEPKYYLWDWSFCTDEGMRFENFIASHLQKAVHFWTDFGFGVYELYFLRDKEKREVDFLITKDNQPWMLVEAKLAKNHLSPSLAYFQKMTKAPYAFQVILDMPYINKSCFEIKDQPLIVPARTFLSQLV